MNEKRKYDKSKSFKAEIKNWIEGILRKEILYFMDYDEALVFCKEKNGHVKIYDIHDAVIYSEEHGKHRKDHNDDGYI